MLILGGLLALRRFHMALHLPDNRQAVDGVSSPGTVNAAHILDLLFSSRCCSTGMFFFL